MSNEPGFRVEIYGGEDGEQNLLDHQTDDLTVRIYHRMANDMARPVVRITCSRLPDGRLETVVLDDTRGKFGPIITGEPT